MAVEKIEYAKKLAFQTNDNVPIQNQCTSDDMNEIKETVNNNADELSTVQQNVENLQEGQGTSNSDISALKTKVSALENDNEQNKTDITNIKKEQTTQNTDITNIKTEQTTQNKDIANIKTEQTTQTKDISDIKEEQTTQNKELEELRKENEMLKNMFPTGETEEAEYLSITDSAEASLKKLKVSGNSKQETREGYNLCNVTDQTKYGVTFKKMKNGILLNGKSTETFDVTVCEKTVAGGNYCIKGLGSTASNSTFQEVIYKNDTIDCYVATTSKIRAFADNDVLKSRLYIYKDTTFNNLLVPVQITKSDDKDYEPYGTMPSEEFPSPIQNIGNNINILNKNNIFSRNGVKTEILETGIRIIDIAQTKFEFIGIPLGGKELLGKNITCYSDVFENKNIYSNAELYFGNDSAPTSGGVIQKQNVSSSITWNIPSSFPNGSDKIRIYLYISGGNPPSSGYSVDYTNLKVEIGDTPTNYSPYGLGNISTVISNKNVFNLKRLIEMSSKYSKIENGYKFSSTGAMYSKGVSCLYPISLPISMSYKIQNLTGTGFRFKFWFDNGKTESLSAYSSGTSSEETNIVINNYTKSRCETNCKNRY